MTARQPGRGPGAAAVVALLLALHASAAVATAEPPPLGLFVLPVQAGSWLSRDDRRLLEARVTVALGRSRLVRAMGPRDLPPRARALLQPVDPGADLSACVTPACLRGLGTATGAVRALGLELLDDGPEAVLFATLFDTRSGAVVARRELPQPAAAPATRRWADEVARWAAASSAPRPPNEPPAGGAPPAGTIALPAAPFEPVVAVDAGPNPRPEAQALAAAISGRLAARGWPHLAAPGIPAPAITHRALVTVDRVAVSQRPHHLHHYRTASLAATFTVSDARTGAVVFADGASSQLTARARDATEQALIDALVEDVASRWMFALEAQSIDRLLIPAPSHARTEMRGLP